MSTILQSYRPTVQHSILPTIKKYVTFKNPLRLLKKGTTLETQVKHIHEDLIEDCRKQDKKAQFEVYRLYYKAMYNTALRIVNNTGEAEDIMQEAFLDAFRKIDTFKGEASFGSWLSRIVVNKSLDAIKRSHESKSIDDIEEAPDEIQEDEDYLAVLSYKVKSIRKAIHLLSDHYRVVLSLYLLEGYDHEEISQILNISNNLSRIRYLRAKRKLIEYLKQDGLNNNIKQA